MVEGLALRQGADGTPGSVVPRLRYGFRLLPLPMLAVVWGLWLVALVLFCTAPAWWGRVPGELATFKLLNRGPAVLAGFTAALCGAIDIDGDPERLIQGLPRAGARLWGDRVVLAFGALLVADAMALTAARIYLPLPLGSALGMMLPSSAMLTALGLCVGGLGGSRIGLGSVLTYSFLGIIGVLAAQQPLRTPYWRIDPFLATQLPFAPALVRINRWILTAAAAGVGMFSAHAWSGADRWGAWRRLLRRGGAGVRMATAGCVAAALLASGAVWVLVRPVLQRQPVRPPFPVGSVRVAGPAAVSVADNDGQWSAVVNVRVTVPALLTSLTVSLPATSVRVDGRRLIPSGRSPGGWAFAGRTLGWAQGPAALHIDLGLQAPAVGSPLAWIGLRIDGAALQSLQVDWPAGATAVPAGAVPCGPVLCWTGRHSALVLRGTTEQGGPGA